MNATKQDFTKMSGPDQVRAYNAMAAEARALGSASYKDVTRFSDCGAGAKRCEALESSVRALRGSAAAVAAEAAPEPAPVAPGRSPAVRHAEANPARAPRSAGKPAGRIEDFRQVRAGTARAVIVEALARGQTVEQAASAAGVDRKTLMVHLACLSRDCAIGYALDGGKVRLLFPEGKTAADAVKTAKA